MTVDPTAAPGSIGTIKQLSEEQTTVVEFLYLTAKDEYCSPNISGQPTSETRVCVFDDPTKEGDQHLYTVAEGFRSSFAVYYEGQVVDLLRQNAGLASLPPGDYMVQLLYGYGNDRQLRSTVRFSIAGDATYDTESPSATITITATESVNVRSGPGTNHDRVGTLSKGESAIAIGRDEAGDWAQFDDGWVSAQYVSASNDIMSLPVTS